MSTNRFVNSKIYKFLDYVLRLLLLNFLIVIPSFSFMIIYSLFSKDTESFWFYFTLVPMVIYFFPSIVATTNVIRQYEDDGINTVFKDFFKSLKKHFIKAFIVGIIIYIFIILIFNSFQYFNINQSKESINQFGLLLTMAFILVSLFVVVHIPLVMSYFHDLTIIQMFKLSLIMAFKGIGTTFLMVILLLIVATLSFLINYVLYFGAIALIVFFLVKLSFKHYIRIYRKVEIKND